MPEAGEAKPCLQTPVHSSGGLAVEQQAEPGGVIQLGGLGIGNQVGESGGGAKQAEFGQPLMGGVMQHEGPRQW